jgi:hypothetical protein
LTAVLDWECASALPLWKACSYPSFLRGRTRRLEPNLGRYHIGKCGQPNDFTFNISWITKPPSYVISLSRSWKP